MLVEYFSKLFYSELEPACLLTLKGDIAAFNPAMAEVTGYSSKEATGLPFKDFLAVNQEELDKFLKTAAGSTDTTPGMLAIFYHDKHSMHFHCHASLIYSAELGDKPYLLLRFDKPCNHENVFALLNSELENMQKKYHELKKQKEQLTAYVQERTIRLHQEIKERKVAQQTLLQTEKMAALGSLVSGVAHEINTPIGIGVTGASHLEDITRQLKQLFTTNNIKKSDLENFLDECEETSRIIYNNLHRASELIHSFKQVAVDQSSEEQRLFNIKLYFEDVLLSLYPTFKKTSHNVTLLCPDDIEINSYPGVFSQILTNLVINSLIHGFEDLEAGNVSIKIEKENDRLKLLYQDDGKGMTEEHRKKVFDPFFTTKRGKGGSGLGMHVVYNLVCEKLSGSIECKSKPGQGVTYEIIIPMA